MRKRTATKSLKKRLISTSNSQLREKVFGHINQGPAKSYLKAPVKVYDKAMPQIDIALLNKTFKLDVETCKTISERVNEGRE